MRTIGLLVATLTFGLFATTARAQLGKEGPFPLPGLSDAELAAFNDAARIFLSPFTIERGLGPAYNQNRCYSCHRRPKIGGLTGGRMVTRFGRVDDGVFDPLPGRGGTVLQGNAISKACFETLPPEANVVAQRRVTSTLGAGLMEAIPDQQIIDRAAAEVAENAARAGRVHMVTGVSDGFQHVGRFGWKSQMALVIDFTADAMLNEMGITTDLFPTDNAPNGNLALLAQCDTVPDPEDTNGVLYKYYDLLKFIAPPPLPLPNHVTTAVVQGEALFHSIGCAFCHYDGYTTASSHPVLDGKSVALYSDLLLHDIGTGDGIVQGDAQGNEFRTAPLWLVRTARPWLHDGRASTLTAVIDAHHVQAEDVRTAYFALSPSQQNAIQQFLKAR